MKKNILGESGGLELHSHWDQKNKIQQEEAKNVDIVIHGSRLGIIYTQLRLYFNY